MKIIGIKRIDKVIDVDYDFNNIIDTYYQCPDGCKFNSLKKAKETILKGHLHGCLIQST